MDEIKTFFNENSELLQSPISDELIHPKIVGNYFLDRNDVSNQVIDWILHHLENSKCPYGLAVAIAKNAAQLIETDLDKQTKDNVNFETEKLLNSVTLYTEAIKKVPSACSYFLEGENGAKIFSSCTEPYLASVFAIKNKRRKMEDRHVVHHDLNLVLNLKDMPAQSYYAVFDGHAGVDAASYASAHLHVNIAKHPSFLSDPAHAVADAYKLTDEQFAKLCEKEHIKSGSTAVCALIREKTVYLSWLGDSQAVLIKDGKPAIVTNPHRAERQDEQKRIEDLGGHITYMGVCRVNGVLAVTRAIGDIDYKPYISNEPDVTTIHLDGTEDFLVLACDGLWDGMSPEDVASALYHNLAESALDEPLDAVAAKLVHQSKLQGSEDNITAVVVFLRDIKVIKEHATELVHQSSSQLNFLGMNGEGSVNADGIINASCSKPTVLELNATSAKKLKNAANVLSSAGLTDPLYACPYPGSAIDGLSYQGLSTDNSIFVHHQNVASCLPPEATALSELPTPPIDDIVASQQFEKLCSDDLCQGLNSLSSELHGSEVVTNPTNINSIDLSPKSDVMFAESKNAAKDISMMKSVANMTPHEAVGIASSVVSNTIETAVKCLSSSELCDPVPSVSTQKLNPYAEPFVMRSFIPGDQSHEEDISKTAVSNNEVIAFSPVEQNTPEKMLTESSKCSDSPLNNKSNVLVDDFSIDSLSANKVEPQNILSSPLTDLQGPSSAFETDHLADASKELTSEFSLLDLNDPGSSYNAENSKLLDQNILSNPLKEPEKSENPVTLQDVGFISSPDQTSIDKALDIGLTSEANPVTNSQSLEAFASKDNVTVDACLASTNIEVQNSSVDELSKDVPQESVSLTPIKSDLQDLILEDGLKQPLCETVNTSSVDHDASALLDTKQENFEQLILKQVLSESNVETAQNLLPTGNLPSSFSTAFPLEGGKSLLPDGSIILENAAKDPLTLLDITDETKSSAAILPSDQVDDCHIETLAVDLQTVPDGVPEAEGVTEDVDSDSEKDGGWSYMKGNTVGSVKPKSNESTPKGLKSVSKPDSLSKVKKDVIKPTLDNKSKLKNPISVDKNKKPIEKKPVDVKDRKPLKMVSSTLPKSTVEKSAKPASTISRVKKEPAALKTTAAPTNKLTRPAAPRSTAPTLNKPAPSTASTERNQTTASKAVGNTLASGNLRPKSGVNTLTTKASTRPGGTSTLSKVQPSNQSNKSNTVPASRSATLNRLAASTVPSRVSTKPPSSKPAASESKPATSESKPKTLPNTMKRTVPSALKKPDIKEAKDIVNKQISAKSTLAASSKPEIKNATSSNKYSATLNNKNLPTKTRTLVKNDIAKKDVPKSAISKSNTKTTTPSKISRDVPKSKVTKSVPTQDKKNEKISADGNTEQKVAEISSVCEEEKFIHEVNDKEVAIKEQAVSDIISDQLLIPVENGIEAENTKPLEGIVSVANSGPESSL